MKLGRLQLGSRPWHHGLLGASSLVFTFAALVTMRDGFLLLSMACTTPLALGSLALLTQAPQFTAIARGIVAPHREAYKRTISVVLYLNLRLARSAGWWPLGARAYGAACAAWALWLLPRSAFDNGNTLVFVVPIFAGVALDARHQLACLGLERCPWNDDVATARTLVGMQLVALVVAFAFTLAFRGYLRTRRLYAASAGAVAACLGTLLTGAVPAPAAAGLAAAVALDAWCAANPPPRPADSPAADARAKSAPTPPSAPPPRVAATAGGAPPAADARGLSAALAYARGKLGAVEVTEYDDDARRVAPSAADVDAVLAACAEKAPRFAADPSARGWAARSLVTHHGNVLKAARVCSNLAKFRDANGWAYRLDGDAAALEKELRSGMHWVLPGHDVLGRRVVVYNARALLERHDIEKLQKMLCLLLERLLLDEGTMRRGVVVVADCRGATASMARRFRLRDVTRGSEMLADAFPCRLRGLYLVGLPGVLKPLVYLVKTFMTKKQRDRVHVSTKELLAAVDRRELPASLGGDDASFDWDAIVDRLLDARPADPPHAWLDDRRPALMVG